MGAPPPGATVPLSNFLPPPGLPPGVGLDLPPTKDPETWEEHTNKKDGTLYYYNPQTKQSVWHRPEGPHITIVQGKRKKAKAKGDAVESTEEIGSTRWSRITLESGKAYFSNSATKERQWDCPKEIERLVGQIDGTIPVESEEAYAPGLEELIKEQGFEAFAKYGEALKTLTFEDRFNRIPTDMREELFKKTLAKIWEERRLAKAEEKRAKKAASKAKGTFEDLLREAEGKFILTQDSTLESMEKVYQDDPRWQRAGHGERQRKIKAAADRKKATMLDQNLTAYKALCQSLLEESADSQRAAASRRSGKAASIALPKWPIMKRKLSLNKLYLAIPVEKRERLFNAIWKEMNDEEKEDKSAKDTKRGPELSYNKRKALQAHREHSTTLDGMAKRRRIVAGDEAEKDLLTVFAERIRTPWGMRVEDAFKALAGNAIFEDDALSLSEKERLFRVYTQKLTAERRAAFTVSLKKHSANGEMGPQLSLAEVFEVISQDRQFLGVPQDLLKEDWETWRAKEGTPDAVASFKRLLQDATFLNADTELSGRSWQRAIDELAEDVRW